MRVRPGRGDPAGPLRAPRPAALRPGARPAGHARRTKPVRRASAGLTPTRAAALLALLGLAGATYGLSASDAFAARRIDVAGATWTGEAAVRDAVAGAAGSNLFALRTGPLEDAVAGLPAVRSAEVSVALPDALRVSLVERVPLVVWRVGDRRLLADADGTLFAELGASPPPEAAALPVIHDRRAVSATLGVGDVLERVDVDAATRLGSLVPSDVGSSAEGLRIHVDDTNGYVVAAVPKAWTAIFGFYTPLLRTPELVPGQVRLLRSLLIGREHLVARVVLADDRNGTYVPRATPKPSATPEP